ncbi:MAG: class II fructose-bisphosphatase [Candidatus Methylomirabilales bacterium]
MVKRTKEETPMDRNLAMDLIRATEAAAMAAAPFAGRRKKNAADQAAVDAMRFALSTVPMDGEVVIGEGEKDEAPMLYIGEQIGTGSPPLVDIAVDPIDGTTMLSVGRPGSISVVALADRGSLFTSRLAYMDKIVVGPQARGVIDMKAPVPENLQAIAKAKGRKVSELTVIALDRPRNAEMIQAVEKAGARLRLITDGDVTAGLLAILWHDGPVDALMGIGGTPEGVITACAVKSLGGDMQGRLWAKDDKDRAQAAAEGHQLGTILTLVDLCSGENIFVAVTGITDGDLVRGVRYFPGGAQTHSLAMRSVSGTVRFIEARHDFGRLRKVAGTRYEGSLEEEDEAASQARIG